MSVQVKALVTEITVCDICGELAHDTYPYFALHDETGEVVYESKIAGDYCKKHMHQLVEQWVSSFRDAGILERYDCGDDLKEKEIAYIKGE